MGLKCGVGRTRDECGVDEAIFLYQESTAENVQRGLCLFLLCLKMATTSSLRGLGLFNFRFI